MDEDDCTAAFLRVLDLGVVSRTLVPVEGHVVLGTGGAITVGSAQTAMHDAVELAMSLAKDSQRHGPAGILVTGSVVTAGEARALITSTRTE